MANANGLAKVLEVNLVERKKNVPELVNGGACSINVVVLPTLSTGNSGRLTMTTRS